MIARFTHFEVPTPGKEARVCGVTSKDNPISSRFNKIAVIFAMNIGSRALPSA